MTSATPGSTCRSSTTASSRACRSAGLGTGSIGRTHRGDFARWHLEVGTHRHEPVAADGVLAVRRRTGWLAGRRSCPRSVRRSCRRGAGPCRSAAGRTTRSSRERGRRSSPTSLAASALIGEQLSPVIAGDLERSALPVGVFEWWLENPGPDPLTVGLLFTWADPPGAAGPAVARPHTVRREDGALAVAFGDAGADAPAGLRGSLAIAALEADGLELSARTWFDPIDDHELWADFAADGRLSTPTPRRVDLRILPPPPAERRSRPPWPSPPASAAPSGSSSPGTSPRSSSGPVGAGGSATRRTGAGPASGPSSSPGTRSPRRPRGGRRSRPGRRPTSPIRIAPTGT